MIQYITWEEWRVLEIVLVSRAHWMKFVLRKSRWFINVNYIFVVLKELLLTITVPIPTIFDNYWQQKSSSSRILTYMYIPRERKVLYRVNLCAMTCKQTVMVLHEKVTFRSCRNLQVLPDYLIEFGKQYDIRDLHILFNGSIKTTNTRKAK
jgi:hypothetical protein